MVITYTTNLGLAKIPDGEETGTHGIHTRADRDKLEARVAGQFAGNPNTNVAGFWVGQTLFDTNNNIMYICTTTGDAANAVWSNIFTNAGFNVIANNLSDVADVGLARTNLGLTIGTNVQAHNASLQSISGLGTTTNQIVYATGLDTFATTALTSVARTFLAGTTIVGLQQAMDTEVGVDVQAFSAGLTDLSSRWTVASASGGSSLQFLEDTDNGINKITLEGAALLGADKVQRLAPETGTVGLYENLNQQCPHKNLAITTLTAATVDLDADVVILFDTSGYAKKFTPLNVTIDIAISGANGLDTGTEAISTWYHIWALGKEDGTLCGVLSLSTTAPTLPSGYVYRGYCGAIYNDVAGNLITLRQLGNKAGIVLQSILNNADGVTASWQPLDISAACPSTAKQVLIKGWVDGETTAGNPTCEFSAYSDGVPALYIVGSYSTGGSDTFGNILLPIATTTIYYRNNFTTAWNLDFNVIGWEF